MASFQGKIMSNDGVLVAVVDNQTYQVTREHPVYDKLFEAYKVGDADEFVRLSSIKQCVETYVSQGQGLVVDGERILYNGMELNNAVVDTIKNMMYTGLDFQPMVKFLERAIQSNSKRVVDELFSFLQVCNLAITEDGCFLAYKSVRSDYKDKYSGQVDNWIGTENRMDKWLVDDDCNNACSQGYHVGALPYAGPGGYYNNSGDKVLICKVAPEDVVSVPKDHSCQKLRTCAYTVVGEFKGELKQTVYSGRVGDDYGKSVEPERKSYELEPQEMVVDGMYTAEYCTFDGSTKTRYFIVLENSSDHVLVELAYPEENEGQKRRFNFDRITSIYEWDGYYSDDDEDEEEDDDDGVDDEYSPW